MNGLSIAIKRLPNDGLDKYNKIIITQENNYTKLIEKIKDQSTELFYMNKAMLDLEGTISAIKDLIEKNKISNDQNGVLLSNNTNMTNKNNR